MAKLPEINYRSVQLPNAPGPARAAAKARNINQATDILTRGLTAINNETRSFNVTRAKVRTQNAIVDAQAAVAGKEFFTYKDLQALNLQNEVDMGGAEYVPAEQVVPKLMSKTMDEAIESNIEGIKNTQDASNWRTEMDYAKDEMMLKVTTASVKQAMSREHQTQEIEIAASKANGNFDGAEALIRERYKDPAILSQELQANRVEAEKWQLNKELMTTDPEQIDDLVDYMISDKFAATTDLSQKEQMTYFTAALNRRNAMVTAQDSAEKEAQDYRSVEALTNITSGNWTQSDIIERRHSFGRTNYQYLLNQSEAESVGATKFATPSITASRFEVSVMELETGTYQSDGTTTFNQEVDRMEAWVMENAFTVDPVTGEEQLSIAGSDVTKWRERLKNLRASPFAPDTQFRRVADELSQRIRGGSEEAMRMAVDTPISTESANLYAESLNALRTYVDENGGPKADVMAWREKNMPYYLGETSRLSFMKLDRGAREYAIQDSSGKVILGETRAAMSAELAAASNERDKATIRRNIATFDKWATGPGVNYVVK